MGEMIMREVDGIDVPAGATVMLRPGGFHVMLLELQKAIAARRRDRGDADLREGR